jgi:DNA-binding SARP family transcriptional activator
MSPVDDPIALLRHLAAAFRPFVPAVDQRIHMTLDDHPLQAYPPQIIDLLLNDVASSLSGQLVLVLDDYHHADRRADLRALIDHLIDTLPPQLHLILSSREYPLLSSLAIRKARGEVYQLLLPDLAFTVDETEAFCQLYEQEPTHDAAELTEVFRGWPLGIQMVVTSHSQQQQATDVTTQPHADEPYVQDNGMHETLAPRPLNIQSLLPLLDEYLTRQVLDEQPVDVQDFLLRTAGLRWFSSDVYDVLPGLHNGAVCKAEVERRCLFLETLPNGQQSYQPMFRDFLQRVSLHRLEDRHEFHHAAADYYREQHDYEGVLHHLLAIGASAEAAEVLEHVGGVWLTHGQPDAILAWLEQLPEAQHSRPLLLELQAAAHRRLGAFEQALALYQQAEEGFRQQNNLEGQVRVLRGQAQVYLDTVQPAPAGALLKQAFKLLPRTRNAERAEILRLQAENWANRGRADIALRIETCARRMAQASHDATATVSEPQLLVPMSTPLLLSRLMLRSGRLNEAQRQLETDLGLNSASAGPEQVSPVLAHREPSLLLAFVYALLGKDVRALAAARRGLLESLQSGSQLTEAIAHMRVGHAYQVIPPLDTAAVRRHYQLALELVEAVGVPRTKVEIQMGLALLFGHSGDLASAEAMAQEALQVSEEAGDDWIAALLWVSLGGAAVVTADERASRWLDHAYQRFVRGNDTYGQAVVELWRALWLLLRGDTQQATPYVARLLELVRENSYEGLLTAPTLFGPRDLAMLIPLLLHGRTLPEYATFAQQLLRQAFPSVASDEMVEDYHPGYTLHIQMLGNFRVWRGIREVQTREWQREKARQLLQLLLTYRGQWLQREQICSWLWPENDLDAAERQFKVTLNALNAALEPQRPPRTMPFFVRRQGLAYSFAPSYGCWIDVDEFELRTTSITQGDEEFLLRNSQIAVNLYKGDYLAEALYDSWTLEERERLMARYLATATALAEKMAEKGDIQQAIQFSERVLRRDRCYEEAYQVLMKVYARSGSRSQALRTYTRCTQALQDELGIEPLPETTELYEHIKQNEKV